MLTRTDTQTQSEIMSKGLKTLMTGVLYILAKLVTCIHTTASLSLDTSSQPHLLTISKGQQHL